MESKTIISPEQHLSDKNVFDGILLLHIDRARKSQLPFALILVDVACMDNQEGRTFMLGNIYKDLKANTFERDFVGCLEGGISHPGGFIRNRYGIITGDIKKLGEVHHIVGKVYKTIRDRSLLKAKSDIGLFIQAGISTYPDDTKNQHPDELFQNAITALETASGNTDSKYPVVYFNPALNPTVPVSTVGF